MYHRTYLFSEPTTAKHYTVYMYEHILCAVVLIGVLLYQRGSTYTGNCAYSIVKFVAPMILEQITPANQTIDSLWLPLGYYKYFAWSPPLKHTRSTDRALIKHTRTRALLASSKQWPSSASPWRLPRRF